MPPKPVASRALYGIILEMNRWILAIAVLAWVFAPVHLHAHDSTDDSLGGSVCVVCQLAQEQGPTFASTACCLATPSWLRLQTPFPIQRPNSAHAYVLPPTRGPPVISQAPSELFPA